MTATKPSLPLSPPDVVEGSRALTHALSGFMTATGRAGSILKYGTLVEGLGIQKALEVDSLITVEILVGEGVLKQEAVGIMSDKDFAAMIANATYQSAQAAIRLAATVVYHAAFDDYLLRLCRIATVFDRAAALAQIADRKVPISRLAEASRSELEDCCLEQWIQRLEDESALFKWDALVRLASYPSQLSEGEWYFDRNALAEFDQARHDAVHSDGTLLQKLDVESAFAQLNRVPLVWSVHLHRKYGLCLLSDSFLTPNGGSS